MVLCSREISLCIYPSPIAACRYGAWNGMECVTCFSSSILHMHGAHRCHENGSWFVHPHSGREWSNYTNCIDTEDMQVRYRGSGSQGMVTSLVCVLFSNFTHHPPQSRLRKVFVHETIIKLQSFLCVPHQTSSALVDAVLATGSVRAIWR